MSRSFPLLLALVAAAPTGAQISVPADQPTLQAAIDASPAGGTILVTTAAPQDPVTIDRAINIIGDPIVHIGDVGSCGPSARTAVTLSGPGSGIVRISGAELTSLADCGLLVPLVAGGGFDALHLYETTALTPRTGLTGYGVGAPAISVSVPFLLVSGCTVRGGADGIDICPAGGFGPTPYVAYPAITTGGTVAILDSSVTGGSVLGSLCCVSCSCPPSLATVGGAGGPGVVASEVLVAGGSVAGGSGADIVADGSACGTAADGLAVTAARLTLPTGFLAGSGQLPLGGVWTLSYLTTGSAMLVFDLGVQRPAAGGVPGYSFMGGTFTTLAPLPPGSVGSLPIALPPNPALAGIEVVFQLLDATSGWSRPVVGMVVP